MGLDELAKSFVIWQSNRALAKSRASPRRLLISASILLHVSDGFPRLHGGKE